jgi:hypothetical protein
LRSTQYSKSSGGKLIVTSACWRYIRGTPNPFMIIESATRTGEWSFASTNAVGLTAPVLEKEVKKLRKERLYKICW